MTEEQIIANRARIMPIEYYANDLITDLAVFEDELRQAIADGDFLRALEWKNIVAERKKLIADNGLVYDGTRRYDNM